MEDREPVGKSPYQVVLDTVISPGLELEGFTREITRKVQELRKKAKLTKSDKIDLCIISMYDLSSMEREIKEKVGAKTLSLKRTNKIYKFSSEETIKGKTFEIKFNKI